MQRELSQGTFPNVELVLLATGEILLVCLSLGELFAIFVYVVWYMLLLATGGTDSITHTLVYIFRL